MDEVKFKLLSENAKVPHKEYKTDSGFDLYASENILIAPNSTVRVPTGVSVGLPENMEAQVRPKSGITAKTQLRVQLGTVDKGFTGEIEVIVDNKNQFIPEFSKYIKTTKNDNVPLEDYVDVSIDVPEGTYVIRKGEKIAQLVVQYLPSVYSSVVKKLDDTDRGSGGFGHTGV